MKTLDVVAGIIWHQGRFLGSRRRKGSHKGLWEFPGGKVDAGESCFQALVRELREELDIEVEDAALWRTVEHAYPDKTVRLHVFQVTAFLGEPRSVEGQPIEWLTVQQARQLEFLEADMPLVAELREPQPEESAEAAASFAWPLLGTPAF